MNTAVSILIILIGAALVAFRGAFARLVVEGQNETWGFRFGTREERVSRFLALLVGLIFLAVGVLALVGVVHWRTAEAERMVASTALDANMPPNKPLERAGMSPPGKDNRGRAGRSAPSR